MLKPRYAFLTLFAALLIAGCAGSKEVAKAPHPLAGAWDWSVDTPQGVFTGVLTFTEVEDMLAGTIGAAEEPEPTAPLEEIMFDSEMSKVTFNYNSGDEFGIMNVTLTLDGDALNGIMNVIQFGVDVPMTCSRKMME
ncbi:MAG: hypothetical protein IH820_14865 [Bacteroidetes bacterium]|nr:hypothetical protein [Bacteroidota bacterium]